MFLAGKDWSWRALLRAQLLEDGIQAEAFETSRQALNTVEDLADLPKLLVADLCQSPRPEEEVDLLSKWRNLNLIPVWLIVSHSLRLDRNLEQAGVERVLYRPVEMNRLVEEIKQRVAV